MTDMTTVKKTIASYEGVKRLLYSDDSNPYESICIYAEVTKGSLTVTDSECEHGPDGGWSHGYYVFDEENTQKVFMLLMERDPNP